MSTLQLSGLASGFDWKTFVDNIIDLERTPGTRMQAEINTNQRKLNALSGLETRLTDLKGAVENLQAGDAFSPRSASASGGWTASASSGATSGSYTFNVTQRATAARLVGAADRGQSIANSSDVSGVTLASLGTGSAVTAGVFTVNGARITVDLADSLQDLFDQISTATGGDVTASYDSVSDRISLTGSSSVVLGSATDTSNFLAVARLNNNGTGTIESGAALGAVRSGATLADARLRTAVTAVDGSGAGSFQLNGVNIAYNLNTDTLNSVIERINNSAAGVRASFDVASDRVVIENTATGDVGFSLNESSGGLLAALGLVTGSTLERGKNAEFTVNGGPTLTSASNTLGAAAHGIAGLSLTPDGDGGIETVTIATDTGSMRAKIDDFITKFNAVQTFIDEQTRITSTNGRVTTATLSDNREIQNWGSQLRATVFATVPGLSSTLSRLDHLGLDFSGVSAQLTVKSEAKLAAALAERPTEVAALFQQSGTGLASRLDTLFDSYIGIVGGAGLLGGLRTNLSSANNSLTTQIADLDRRLVQRRSQLETGFIEMERAQSTIQQMQSQLTRAFPTNSTSR